MINSYSAPDLPQRIIIIRAVVLRVQSRKTQTKANYDQTDNDI
jgi:hypothetical protein